MTDTQTTDSSLYTDSWLASHESAKIIVCMSAAVQVGLVRKGACRLTDWYRDSRCELSRHKTNAEKTVLTKMQIGLQICVLACKFNPFVARWHDGHDRGTPGLIARDDVDVVYSCALASLLLSLP